MINWITKWVLTAYAQPNNAGLSVGAGIGMSKLAGLINKVISIVEGLEVYILGIAGLIMVLMLVFGGIQYITGQAEAGKKTITATIVGGIIVGLATAIINLAISLIQ